MSGKKKSKVMKRKMVNKNPDKFQPQKKIRKTLVNNVYNCQCRFGPYRKCCGCLHIICEKCNVVGQNKLKYLGDIERGINMCMSCFVSKRRPYLCGVSKM